LPVLDLLVAPREAEVDLDFEDFALRDFPPDRFAAAGARPFARLPELEPPELPFDRLLELEFLVFVCAIPPSFRGERQVRPASPRPRYPQVPSSQAPNHRRRAATGL
jgi:hypothetical protein